MDNRCEHHSRKIFFQELSPNFSTKFIHVQRYYHPYELTTTIMLWCDNVIMWIGWVSWTNYKVRPIVIPIILDSVQDFQRLEHAAQSTKRYLFRFVSFFLSNQFVHFCNSLFVFATILFMSAIFHIIFNGKYYLFEQEIPLQICLSEFFAPTTFDNNVF